MKWPFSSPSLRTVMVEGESMAPAYNDGDWLLVSMKGLKRNHRGISSRGWSSTRVGVKVGAVLLIEREEQPGIIFIKRLIDIRMDSPNRHYPTFWVEGDNKSLSQDSRSWGAISGDEIIGKVLFRVKKNMRKSEN
jgi:signal peptidase I